MKYQQLVGSLIAQMVLCFNRPDNEVLFEKEHDHLHSVGSLLIVANSGSKVGAFSTKRSRKWGGRVRWREYSR